MPIQVKAELVEKKQIKEDIFKFSLKADEVAKSARPGNFVEVKVSDNIDPFLRRPIGLYNVDKEKGIVEFIFQVRGRGTEILAQKKEGELVDIIGPLGYGTFQYEKYQNIAIIGGGTGVFPLYELAKNAKRDGKNVNMYLGFRTKELVLLPDEFESVSTQLTISTNDGSYGKEGHSVDFLIEDVKMGKIDCILACGPMPMLKVIKKIANEYKIPCQVSLEEKMACGLGACLGCAVKTAKSSDENPEYWHVCKAGPVFNANDVDF